MGCGFFCMLLHMDPADQLCIRVRAAGCDPGGGSFQIGDHHVVGFLHHKTIQPLCRQQFHHVDIPPELAGKSGNVGDMALQMLPVDTHVKEGLNRNIILFPA